MINSRTQSTARRRGSSPTGMTLVEVMVVVAVSSLILATLVSFVIALKKMDRKMRTAAIQSVRRLELAETLRSDIRLGTAVSLSASDELVVTMAGGGERRYVAGSQGCRRSTVREGDTKAFSDLFAVGPAESWTVEEGQQGRHPLYIVTLDCPAADETQAARMALLVCGALGADLPAAATVPVSE